MDSFICIQAIYTFPYRLQRMGGGGWGVRQCLCVHSPSALIAAHLHLLIYTVYQSIFWPQLQCSKSHWTTHFMFVSNIKMKRSVTLIVPKLLVPIGLLLVFQKPLMIWDFHTQQHLKFTQNGARNKKSSMWVTVMWVELLCWWERSEKKWPDWFKLIMLFMLCEHVEQKVHKKAQNPEWMCCYSRRPHQLKTQVMGTLKVLSRRSLQYNGCTRIAVKDWDTLGSN